MFTIKFPEYLANVSYFFDLSICEHFLIADHFYFRKRSAMSRANIDNNILSIPVVHKGRPIILRKKEIAFFENWQQKHLKYIYHSFHKLSYFDYYFPVLEELINRKHVYLIDLLIDLNKYFLKCLKLDLKLTLTSAINFTNEIEKDIVVFSKNKETTTILIPENFEKFINCNFLKENDIDLIKFSYPSHEIMRQNILEVLFKYGPEAAHILQMLKNEFKLP